MFKEESAALSVWHNFGLEVQFVRYGHDLVWNIQKINCHFEENVKTQLVDVISKMNVCCNAEIPTENVLAG